MVKVAIRPQQYPKPPDSEKLTVNLGFVDLGSIDLLVRDGFYSNRSDFIRTAIRNQLATHADTAKQAASRLTLELGLRTFGRQDLEAAQAAGERLRIRVLGLAVIADDVTPDLAKATIEIDHRARGAACARRGQGRARRSPALTYSDKEQTMKLRVLEVMNDALGLVKKSDLSGATALIRKALSGEPAEESESGAEGSPSVGEGHPAPPSPSAGRNPARSARSAAGPARPRPPRGRARPRRTLPQADV